ncbi:acetoin utilization protein AcuB [Lederbergia galactosidilyticus]|uniref:Acetoin utilization protein AcuB n=1 Tax=Lederbergia galactosidilytica TaxID=217031 RepID=A0A0Q9YBF0_9BACI|nr:acetoin utilization AcuB family protein [Lederbergia galactosidilytica]KRG13272.1 acetoin utilization protein AcuB [Lederbergia galactosidilytica]MBP1915346.1 acetoin utilization protein AcuB [Lederbergia galactosidilytica]OAK68165.1 acetoin utilization protein AcuB [Lederbergia galactosidilytica]
MIVEEIMKKNVITLTPDDSLRSAIELMHEAKIRHLPLINDKHEIVGLVTERDIKAATPVLLEGDKAEDLLEQPLSKLMITSLITGHPLDFVEEVAYVLYIHRIGCLPIVQNKKLVGIVTGTDLLHTFVKLTGADQPGSQIEIRVPNRVGILHEVTSIFKNNQINVLSVLLYPDSLSLDHKVLVFRVATMNPLKLVQTLKEFGLDVIWPNTPGLEG